MKNGLIQWRRQDGQAFMLGLFIVLATFLLVGLIYNTGVLLSHKMALQNAADVSALTAAMVQAHGLNRIIDKEKEIARTYVAANADSAGYIMQEKAVSMAAARTFKERARAEIEKLVQDIEGPGGIIAMYPLWARNMAIMIGQKNYKDLAAEPEVIYPRRLENRLTILKERQTSPFYYYYRDECTLLNIPCFKWGTVGNLRTWHKGKRRDPMTVVAVRLRSKPIDSGMLFAGKLLAPSGIPPMEAVAAAKPFGGYVVADEDAGALDPVARTVPLPWLLADGLASGWGPILRAHLLIDATILLTFSRPPQYDLPSWTDILNPFTYGRGDYEAFLVSVGDPRVADQIGYAIPQADEYLH